MAKSSRRGKAPQVEEEVEDVMEDEGAPAGDTLMNALLVVSFAFIFVGIVLAWWTLHKNFDTPFLGVVQKDPGQMVQVKAKKDFAKETGLEVADDEGDLGEDGGDEEAPAEGDEGGSEEE